jgi:ATP-binding cassette, subfamily B, bacterial PglK
VIDTLTKINSFFNKKERTKALKIIFLVIFMAILETAGIASVMPLLSVVGNPILIETNQNLNYFFIQLGKLGLSTYDEFIIMLGGISFLLIVFSSIYRIITFHVMNRFTESMRYKISANLLYVYFGQKYEFFLNRHSSELTKCITSEVDHIIVGIFRPVISMFAYVFVTSFIVLFLVYSNPKIAFITAGSIGFFYFLFFFLINGKLKKLGEKLVFSNKERFKIAAEALSSIKLLKLTGCEARYLELYRSSSKEFSLPLSKNLTLTMLPKFFVEALAFGGVIVLVITLIITRGGVSSNALGSVLPVVGLYVFAAYRLQPAFQSIFNGVSALRFGAEAVNNIFNDIHMKFDDHPAQTFSKLAFKRKISFENLSFVYPNSDREGLSDINFNIPFGSSIGIVGCTGAGKTTLVDILLGLLLPTRGSITVDDETLDQSNIRSWQNTLGYVPQEITLFDSSIGENIAMGVPRNQINWSSVENCAKMAQIHDFITFNLPDKYETTVGERGVRLSGGQRQRIGIARALYNNPQVLVFDEATSALDLETEKTVIEAIKNLSNDRTVITIAHRLSTVKNCDQIIMLDEGKIKKIGDYASVFINS